MRGDLVVGEESGGFWHFLADLVVRVLPHLLLVAGFLPFLELDVLALEQVLIDGGLLQDEVVEREIEGCVAVVVLGFLVVHPLVVGDRLEEQRHLVLEALKNGLSFLFGLDAHNCLVDGAHDEVVVLAVLPELEADLGLVEEVVGAGVGVVDFSDGVVEVAVNVLRAGHGILAEHVLEDVLLQVVVDLLEVVRLQVVGLGQLYQVLQDLLRAVDLGVLEAQLVGRVEVEALRPHHRAQRRQVLLQRLL